MTDDPIIAQMQADQADTASAPAGADDPIIAQMREEQANLATSRAALAIGAASTGSADRAAQNIQLAKQFKVPSDVVDKWPDQFRQYAITDAARTALANAPTVTSTLGANPDLAKVMHDEIPVAGALEQSMQAWNPSLGQRFTAWLQSALGVTARNNARAANEVAAREAGMDMGQAREAVGGMSELPEQVAGGALHTGSFGLLPNPVGDAQTPMGQVGAGAGDTLGFLFGGPAKAAEWMLGKLGVAGYTAAVEGASRLSNAARITAAEVATLGTASALGAAGDAVNSDSVGQGLAKMGVAGLQGMATGAVFGGVKAALPGEGVLQFLGRAAGFNIGNDLASGNTPWDNRSIEQKVFDYGLNTLFAKDGVHPEVREQARADFAVQDAQWFANLANLVQQMKMRERTPEEFKQMVSDMADAHQAPDLYVDAKTLANVLDQSGIKGEELMATLPDVASQMREALQTEGTVKIPLEDYASHIVGSTVDEALRPELRIGDPQAATYNEGVAYYQDQARRMQEAAKAATGEKAQDDLFKASGKQVEDFVQGQLDQTGRFPSEVNKAYASMYRAFFESASAKDEQGRLPHELMKEYGLEVRSDHLPGEGYDQSAYHGTPHRGIDKFSTDKIGTGEGAQAYGWGLYFASRREVAEHYRKTLTSTSGPANDVANYWLDQAGGNRAKALELYRAYAKDAGLTDRDTADVLGILSKEKGQLYEVDIPEDEHMLHWDKPLSEQPAGVREALEQAKADALEKYRQNLASDYAEQRKPSGEPLGDDLAALLEDPEFQALMGESDAPTPEDADKARLDAAVENMREILENKTGQGLYKELAGIYGSDKAASEHLATLGIKGIKYLDGTSRADGEGSHNYVIFHGDDVQIKNQFYQSAHTPLAEGQTHVEVDGVQRHALNSEGRPIAATEEGVRNFWRWFGDSKVVDDSGKPLVVYRGEGTGGDFEQFDRRQTNENAFFFTADKDIASVYARGGEPRQFYLKSDSLIDLTKGAEGRAFIREWSKVWDEWVDRQTGEEIDPVDHVQEGRLFDYEGDWSGERWKDLQATIESEGHDGAILPDWDNDRGTFKALVVFDPHQIKSATGNDGGFDPQNPSILRQDARGQIAFDGGKSIISLLKNADLSTFLHESGHFFLEVSSDMAAKAGADSVVGRDFQKLLDWFGVKDADTWRAMSVDQKREFHEQFARGFEAYLMEGKAPTQGLSGIFGRFRSWLVSLYKDNPANLSVSLTPEVRGVMDRMLASEEAIAQAEHARGLLPLFDEKPEGMSEDAWTQYQADAQAATEEAVSTLQGKSIRDMQWMANKKAGAIRALNKEAREARSRIKAEVTQQVEKMPAFAAKAEMDAATDPLHEYKTQLAAWREQRNAVPKEQRDQWVKDNPEPAKPRTSLDDWNDARSAEESRVREEEKAKATEGLKGLEKGQALAKAKRKIDNTVERRMLDWESQNAKPKIDRPQPDMEIVAERHGFGSAEEMLRAIRDAGERKDVIEGLTDQRMLQEHGELTDPVSIERAAEAAIHNEVRTRVLARELNALAKATGSARLLVKAAGEAADAAIGAKRVGEINPRQYQVAEGRAGKAAMDALKGGDTQTAAIQKRAQILNNVLARKAAEAQEKVGKILTYMKRFERVATLKNIAPEEREQILKLLANYDFRKNPTDEPTRAQKNLQQWLESQQMAGYSPVVDPAALAAQPRTQYRDMPYEALTGLYDTVRSIEHIGRAKTQADWEGKKVSLDDLVRNIFVPKMQERGDHFTSEELHNRDENRSVSPARLVLDKMASFLRASLAELKPQYFKSNAYDSHEILGPFHSLFDQVFNANYRKVDMTREQSLKARELAARLGKDWQKSIYEKVANTTLIDLKASEEAGKFVPLSITRDNLIQMLAHAGNESNFDKLVKGYGWQADQFWKFMDGKLSARDVEAVKAQWEMADAHWPEVKAMYERMGQVVPPKVEGRAFRLRLDDGTTVELPGGYMPIRYDPLRSRLGEKKQAERAISADGERFGYDFFGRDTTTNGSMNARVDGYTDAIDLTHDAFERAMAETIHDLAYRETLVNVNKIITHPDFRKQFYRTFGREDYDALHTWLGRIANSENMDREVGNMGRVMRYTRTGMVMNAIALRVSTVLKHGGSAAIKTLGYFIGGGKKYYAARQAAMATDYKAQMAEAVQKFPEIRARALQQDRDYRETVSSLYTGDSLQARAERFGHAAVAWADLFTATATAHAAYDWAITEGIPKRMGGTGAPMTHEQAVSYANQVVREAHGSQIESMRSNIMTNPHEGVKMFTTLYGFMNNTLGQVSDTASKLQTAGLRKPEVMARALMALVVPALWAGILTDGVPTQQDWKGWLAKALGGETLGMVPFARDAYSFLQGYKHAGVIGVESWMQSVLQPVLDAKKAVEGKEVPGAISHAADAIGMGLHIPGLGQLGKTAQYLWDVHTGKQQPASAAEALQGATVGVHKAKP